MLRVLRLSLLFVLVAPIVLIGLSLKSFTSAHCTPVMATNPALTQEERIRIEQERGVILDEIKTKFISLSELEPEAARQELLTYLRGRPEFVEADISDTNAISARFNNGPVIIINTSRPQGAVPIPTPEIEPQPALSPEPSTSNSVLPPAKGPTSSPLTPTAPTTQGSTAERTELPGSNRVRLLNGFGPGWSNMIPTLRSWLVSEQKYDPVGGAEASIDALRSVGGDGVFYISTHGGFFPQTVALPPPEMERRERQFALWTTTKRDVGRSASDLWDDLNPPDILTLPRVVLSLGNESPATATTPAVYEWHYAITAGFVRAYWGNFARHSFVYVDACFSDDPEAWDFKSAVLEKGASVYAGWTEEVEDAIAAYSALLVFDRLLGKNHEDYLEEGFKQRPFDYDQVKYDLGQHNAQGYPLGVWRATGASLEFTPRSANGNFGLLAPSIWRMFVDEDKEELIIEGTFGSDLGQGNRSVSVNCPPQTSCESLNIKEWKPEKIVCDLPREGDRSSGDVVVEVRGHKSNVAQLTEWEGDFTYTLRGTGPYKQTQKYHIRLRADIRKRRTTIHEPPSEPQQLPGIHPSPLDATRDSSATYSSQGTDSIECGPGLPPYVETWSGDGILLRSFTREVIADGFMNVYGYLHSSRKIDLLFGPVALTGLTITYDACGNLNTVSAPLAMVLFSMTPMGALVPIELDEQGNIQRGDKRGTIYYFNPFSSAPNTTLMEWDLIRAKHPPKEDSAR